MTREAVRVLVEMEARLLLAAVEGEGDSEDVRMAKLGAAIDEPWARSIVEDNLSPEAIAGLGARRVTQHEHLVEVARLLDLCCVDDVVRNLLKVMVPGHGYEPVVSEAIVLLRAVSLTAAGVRAVSQNVPSDSDDYVEQLVERKAVEWLAFFLDNGPKTSYCMCSLCAKYGHLDLLEWSRGRDCDWTGLTPATAAQYGHLDVLQYAVANGCPWDQRVLVNARRFGHDGVLKWAEDNNCPYDLNYAELPVMTLRPPMITLGGGPTRPPTTTPVDSDDECPPLVEAPSILITRVAVRVADVAPKKKHTTPRASRKAMRLLLMWVCPALAIVNGGGVWRDGLTGGPLLTSHALTHQEENSTATIGPPTVVRSEGLATPAAGVTTPKR